MTVACGWGVLKIELIKTAQFAAASKTQEVTYVSEAGNQCLVINYLTQSVDVEPTHFLGEDKSGRRAGTNGWL